MIFFRLLPLEMASTFFVDSPLWHLSSSTPRDSSWHGQQERWRREAGDVEGNGGGEWMQDICASWR
jgi:hypothetical protein